MGGSEDEEGLVPRTAQPSPVNNDLDAEIVPPFPWKEVWMFLEGVPVHLDVTASAGDDHRPCRQLRLHRVHSSVPIPWFFHKIPGNGIGRERGTAISVV